MALIENKENPSGKAITLVELREFQDTLEKYKRGKANLDKKLIENEDWWKLNHGRYFGRKHKEWHNRTQSSWMFNSLMNKHADAMDNYPEPTILPRERSDEQVAKTLSSILPVIMDNCNFEQTYSDAWWDKLKNGSCIYGVFFNPTLYNGLGDIDIKEIDALQFYYESGVQDIQDSKHIFLITMADNKDLEAQYPQLNGKLGNSPTEVKKYNYDDNVSTDGKSCVVDVYYKVNHGNGDILHYVKYVGDELLFASENEPEYQEYGFYKHGKYPFVVDGLFPEKGHPMSFGFIDVMKTVQEDIDEMNHDFRLNSKWGAKPKIIMKDSAGINEEEFTDPETDIVHCTGSPNDDNFRQVDINPLPAVYLNYYQARIEELKETSGNRDFSNGSTASGVTSGSAISALIESGSKGSRDFLKASYRAYSHICELVIELVRQFYDETRTFRITGQTGQTEFVDFNNAPLQGQMVNDFGMEFKTKEPVFDIKVKAQKSSPYTRLSQNELALQFYQLGFFNPELSDQALATIDMMDFDGKQKTIERIQQNGTMFQQMQQMQQTMGQMAQALAEVTGDTRVLDALGQQGMLGSATAPSQKGNIKSTQGSGDMQIGIDSSGNSEADKMARKVKDLSTPK